MAQKNEREDAVSARVARWAVHCGCFFLVEIKIYGAPAPVGQGRLDFQKHSEVGRTEHRRSVLFMSPNSGTVVICK